ncbi:hypothetical protein [Actinoallomurus purpureus]|nr:hypothetical protein [Actinoallomurus purpureus]
MGAQLVAFVDNVADRPGGQAGAEDDGGDGADDPGVVGDLSAGQ